MMALMSQLDDKSLRMGGLFSMCAGVFLLALIR